MAQIRIQNGVREVFDVMNKRWVKSADQSTVSVPEVPTDTSFQTRAEQIAFDKARVARNKALSPVSSDVVVGTVTAPKFAEPTAPSITFAYTESLLADLQTKRKALDDAYKSQLKTIADKQLVTQKKIDEFTAKQEKILTEDVKPLTDPFRMEFETSERERLQVEKNFFDNQSLVNELDTLLTEGNALIKQQMEVTGLGVIRNPRINKTISDLNARVGVINSVMAARSGQIAEAYRLIDRGLAATTADRQDQLGYYETLLNFYGSQKDVEGNKLIRLEADEDRFITAQVNLIASDLSSAQATADYIKKLMIDPATALDIANAGVTLNDSVEEINRKMAEYSYVQEIRTIDNELSTKGYQHLSNEGELFGKKEEDLIRIKDSKGVERIYWKKPDIIKGKVGGLDDVGDVDFSDMTDAEVSTWADDFIAINPEKTNAELKDYLIGNSPLSISAINAKLTVRKEGREEEAAITNVTIESLIGRFGLDYLHKVAKANDFAKIGTGKQRDVERLLEEGIIPKIEALMAAGSTAEEAIKKTFKL